MGNGEWGMGKQMFCLLPLHHNPATPNTRLYDFLFPTLDSREDRQAFSAIFLAFSTASSIVPTM
jgi:hypothetical protein